MPRIKMFMKHDFYSRRRSVRHGDKVATQRNAIIGRYYGNSPSGKGNHTENRLSQVSPEYLLALIWWEAGGFNPSAEGVGVYGEPVIGLFQMNADTLAEVQATSYLSSNLTTEDLRNDWRLQIEAGLLLYDLHGISRWDARSEQFAKAAGPALEAQFWAIGPSNPQLVLNKSNSPQDQERLRGSFIMAGITMRGVVGITTPGGLLPYIGRPK